MKWIRGAGFFLRPGRLVGGVQGSDPSLAHLLPGFFCSPGVGPLSSLYLAPNGDAEILAAAARSQVDLERAFLALRRVERLEHLLGY